jgi:hypothetical protein
MEINITKFFKDAAPMDYSASRAEIGDNAGADTWQAACNDADNFNFIDTEDKRQGLRDHMAGFGAWNDTEIAAWTDTELNALFLQLVAGDVREVPGMDISSWDWTEYEKLSQDGVISGRMFQGIDGNIYYYIGD